MGHRVLPQAQSSPLWTLGSRGQEKGHTLFWSSMFSRPPSSCRPDGNPDTEPPQGATAPHEDLRKGLPKVGVALGRRPEVTPGTKQGIDRVLTAAESTSQTLPPPFPAFSWCPTWPEMQRMNISDTSVKRSACHPPSPHSVHLFFTPRSSVPCLEPGLPQSRRHRV
jgi:hypothetical protein